MKGDPETVAEALNLKRSGGEYKGACPLCGGHDRFHVKQGRHADLLIYCRHGCRFTDIAKVLESRGLVRGDEFVRPRYRRDDLEMADHVILVMESAARRGDTIQRPDEIKFNYLAGKIDETRAARIRALIKTLRGHK
jgi:hypothetical protein